MLQSLADEAAFEAAQFLKTAVMSRERLRATFPDEHLEKLSVPDLLSMSMIESLDLQLINQRLAQGASRAQEISASFYRYKASVPRVRLYSFLNKILVP